MSADFWHGYIVGGIVMLGVDILFTLFWKRR